MSSEKRPHILNLDAARRQCGPASEKEVAARGRPARASIAALNDLEWARARARLLDFVSVLRAWHRKGTTTASELPMAA